MVEDLGEDTLAGVGMLWEGVVWVAWRRDGKYMLYRTDRTDKSSDDSVLERTRLVLSNEE